MKNGMVALRSLAFPCVPLWVPITSFAEWPVAEESYRQQHCINEET